MRLSVNQDSPHYDGWALVNVVKVSVDGIERRDVVEFDSDEGWVDVLTQVDGRWLIEDGIFVRKRVHGAVTVEWRNGSGRIRCLDCGREYKEAPPAWSCPDCGGPVSQKVGEIHVPRRSA